MVILKPEFDDKDFIFNGVKVEIVYYDTRYNDAYLFDDKNKMIGVGKVYKTAKDKIVDFKYVRLKLEDKNEKLKRRAKNNRSKVSD